MLETTEYWAPPHIRFAITATGVVYLDLKRTRYKSLSSVNTSELAVLAQNWFEVSNSTVPLDLPPRDRALRRASALVEAGLLTCQPSEIPFQTTRVDVHGVLTSVGLERTQERAVRMQDCVVFWRACWWAKRVLRSKTLYEIAFEVSRSKHASRSMVEVERMVELVCVFRKLRPFAFEAKDRCLFHALALIRFLAAFDVHPTWVIGVRPIPWGAHSWVQHEGLLLDASPEDVCSFTPILAI